MDELHTGKRRFLHLSIDAGLPHNGRLLFKYFCPVKHNVQDKFKVSLGSFKAMYGYNDPQMPRDRHH